MIQELPPPECSMGYTSAQLDTILGTDRERFNRWMRGQTVALCDGREYDHVTKEYHETGHAHGVVVYGTDLRNFLVGGPVLD